MSTKARMAKFASVILVGGATWLATAADPIKISEPRAEAAPQIPTEHEAGPHDAPAPPRPRVVSPALAPELLRRGRFQSVQVNVDANRNNIVGDAANEPTIAVDPTNPNNIVIGWRQFDSVTSNFRQAGWAYSHDGGHTWTFPGVLQADVFRSDPVLAVDADGNFYYYSLTDSTPYTCQIFKSDDGGVSWAGPIQAYGGDKAWIEIDRTLGIGRHNIYGAWDNAGCCGDRWFTRSTDRGQTYMNPIKMPGQPYMGTVAVGPAGDVYVAGLKYNSTAFGCVRSSNAQDPLASMTFELSIPVDLGGNLGGAITGPNPGGLVGQVWVACNRAIGPAQDNVYILCSVEPSDGDPLDVMFIRSTDKGATWSAPIRVNDDPPGTNAWQWFGTMSVAPNGRIDVIWNDTRRTQSDHVSELYYSYSLDGGAAWSVNLPVAPAFDSWIGWPDQNKIGDYYHTVSDDAGVNVAFAATFNGEQDVYFLRIEPLDCNANGVPDDLDLAAGTSTDLNQNGIPDECEPDCDGDGLPDSWTLAEGLQADCNHNFVPDACDIASGFSRDANLNGIPDECEVCAGRTGYGIIPTGAAESDNFGISTAVFGDRVVVGAQYATWQGRRTGRAYVFRNEGRSWPLEVVIQGTDAWSLDRFGAAVAINGNTIAVGAPGKYGPGSDSGAAYVFRLTDAGWIQQAKLVAPDGATNEYFGKSVAVSGGRIFVGVSGDSDLGSSSGSVYVFLDDGGAYVQEAKLLAADGAAGDYFGSPLAASGDTLIVGASGSDVQGTDSGTAYIFRRRDRGWTQEAKLVPPDGRAGAKFGTSVAISGPVVFAGGYGTDAATAAGAVYVYRFDGSSWVQEDKLVAPDRAPAGRFGGRAAVAGEVALVSTSDTVYLFRHSVSGWFGEATLTAADGAPGEAFGVSVAVGRETAVIGASTHTVNGLRTGAVYLLRSLSDCNGNGVLDACDVGSGTPDCNGDGVPDECDIASGASADAEGNGIPDECEGLKGDLNCDGAVNGQDIDGFVLVLLGTDAPTYSAYYAWGGIVNPPCSYLNGDMNGDGAVNGQDIDGFVAAFLGK